MTLGLERRAARRPSRRRTLAWVLLLVLAGAILFALGVGLGQALEENRLPEDQRTYVRTLQPLPLAPETVTVTVTAP